MYEIRASVLDVDGALIHRVVLSERFCYVTHLCSLLLSYFQTKKSTRTRRGPGRPSAAMKEALAEANSAAANHQSVRTQSLVSY